MQRQHTRRRYAQSQKSEMKFFISLLSDIKNRIPLKISINKDIPYHISAQRGTLAFPININIETAKIISKNRLLNANANNHFITLRITAGVANKGNLLNKLLILSSFLFIFMIF